MVWRGSDYVNLCQQALREGIGQSVEGVLNDADDRVSGNRELVDLRDERDGDLESSFYW